MKKCEKCNVYVNTQRKTCPLCFEPLTEMDKEELEYPVYPDYVPPKRKTNFFIKSMTFLAIASIIITAFINIATYTKETGLWFLYVVASVLYFLVLIRSMILSRSNTAKKILTQMVTLSALVVGIDLISNSSGWSYTYIIPCLSVISTLTIGIILLSKTIRYSDYIVYLLVSLLLGLVPFIFWIFKLVNVLWPSLMAASFSLVVFIAMVIFADESTKEELKKRFHI